MKSNLRKLRVSRVFSEEFKRQCVKEYETGKLTVKEICLLYHLHEQNVYSWIHKYSVYKKKGLRVIEMASSSSKKVKELQSKIKDLERIVGQKQINIDFLEKLIDIAEEELGVDIKKKPHTSQSSGSGKIKKK